MTEEIIRSSFVVAALFAAIIVFVVANSWLDHLWIKGMEKEWDKMIEKKEKKNGKAKL